MRLHRFFVGEALAGKKEFSTHDPELIHQWKDVFRLGAGDRIILLDDSGYEFYATLTLVSKGGAAASVDEARENTKPKGIKKYEVHLYCALIKKGNFEWILEKGTELGVTRFVPVVSSRSEKKNLNPERARKIIREASEQSGRGVLPVLGEVSDLASALSDEGVRFAAFHLEGTGFDKNIFAGAEKVGIVVGPEGGWTDEELAFFRERNVPIVSVGPQVLRAETAAIAVSSLVLLG